MMYPSLKTRNCTRYHTGTPPLSDTAENELLGRIQGWRIDRGGEHRLVKSFDFHSFVEAIGFVNTLGLIAEEEQHHPAIRIDYRTVSLEITTHSTRGLTENDFIMAAKTDNLYFIVTEPVFGVLESAML